MRLGDDDASGRMSGSIGEIRWAGEASSDPAPTFSRALLASVASHFADLITIR